MSHRAYARLVVAAYMRRHAPVAWKRGDWATCAAIHNAGVRGVAKGRGKAYARRVIALMTAEKSQPQTEKAVYTWTDSPLKV